MTRAKPAERSATDQLALLFGETAETAETLLRMIDSDPRRWWQPSELTDQTGLNLVEVMVVVARLTAAGMLRHDGLGSGYRSMSIDEQVAD